MANQDIVDPYERTITLGDRMLIIKLTGLGALGIVEKA
jgi:hypothetical protein